MASKPTFPRWCIQASKRRFDLWFMFRPSKDGEIWTRSAGITVCAISEKNHGEEAGHFWGFDFLGVYFGTRFYRGDK